MVTTIKINGVAIKHMMPDLDLNRLVVIDRFWMMLRRLRWTRWDISIIESTDRLKARYLP